VEYSPSRFNSNSIGQLTYCFRDFVQRSWTSAELRQHYRTVVTSLRSRWHYCTLLSIVTSLCYTQSAFLPWEVVCSAVRPFVTLRYRIHTVWFTCSSKISCGANAQQTPPSVAHRGIARFLGIYQKCNQVVPWSLPESTPSLKISCKSVQPFSRNLVDKEINKQRNKQTKE